jgi:hypothetical protein
MENTPSLLNPNSLLIEKAKKELNIANEIYLAKRCSSIHYADLMNGLPEELASKTMLINWLNDYTKKGNTLRKGLLAAYQSQHPEHFINGVWQSYHFPLLIEFVAKSLVDIEVLNGKKKAELFAASLQHDEWVEKASAVIGLKMLEKLFSQGRLVSKTARAILRLNYHAREFLEKNNKSLGRQFRNHEVDRGMYSDFHHDVERYFKMAFDMASREFADVEENRIYSECEEMIRRDIMIGTKNALDSMRKLEPSYES